MIFFFRENLHAWLLKELGFRQALTADMTLILISVVAAALMAVVATRMARIPANLRRYDPDEHDQRFNGIGGTLLIAAAVVSVLPLIIGAEIVVDRFLWSTEAAALFESIGPAARLWLGFNAASVGIRLVFALLLVWLFYRRRRFFRVATILYLLLTVVIFLIHDMLLSEAFTNKSMVVFENFTQLTRSLQITILVIPYILFARRIQATMRN